MSDDTINAAQCAELLQCTEYRVEELTRIGELPGMKYGRGWIFVKADLLAYIAERARKEAEERRSDRQARLAAPLAFRKAAPEDAAAASSASRRLLPPKR